MFIEDLLYSVENLVELQFKDDWVDQKTTDRILNKIIKEVKKEQKEWVKDVKEKTSEQIPLHLLGRKRPQNRKFPYRFEGDLTDSFNTNLILTKKDSTHYTLLASFSNSSGDAYLTEKGITSKGIGGSQGDWVGWFKRATVINNTTPIKSAEHRLNEVMKNVALQMY